MERLTEKICDKERTNIEKYCDIQYYGRKGYEGTIEILNKIGKLEDLEEQIGISLEDFYACVTHNEESFFIIEMNDDSEEFEIIEVFKEDGYMHNYSHEKFMFCGHAYDTNENYYEMVFENYKKDMFLTYEEAEKKLEEMKNEK